MFNPQKTALTSDDAMHEQEKTIRQILQVLHGDRSNITVFPWPW